MKYSSKFINEVALNLIKTLDSTEKQLRSAIINFIESEVGVGTVITFNDETGLPYYNDDGAGVQYIVGARVVEKTSLDPKCKVKYLDLEINLDCGDDEYGLDSDAWFDPDGCGKLDYANFHSYVVDAVARIPKTPEMYCFDFNEQQ